MIRPTARIDVSPVATYYGQLAAALRQDTPRTVRMEAAATVRRAMQMVTSASVADIKRSALYSGVSRFVEGGKIGGTTSVGTRSKKFGQQWMVRRDLGRVMPMSIWSGKLGALPNHTRQGWHASDADWALYKAAWAKDVAQTKKDIARRLGARGLTAKSWLDILEKIHGGQTQGVAAFIFRARPINAARQRVTGFASGRGEGTPNFELTVTNTSGIAIATGGDRKLASAITIRRKFFMDSLRKGFLADARFVARSYPWAKVN